jgi:hypothetical protein
VEPREGPEGDTEGSRPAHDEPVGDS